MRAAPPSIPNLNSPFPDHKVFSRSLSYPRRTRGPELAALLDILSGVRPKSQLVLHDAALRPPSPVTEYLSELKKNSAVSGYHYVPAREPRLVDLPVGLHPSIRAVLAYRGIAQLY